MGSLSAHAIERMHRRGDELLLYELDVRPECRGRGVGRALVAAFVEMARGSDAREVWVLTNASNAAAMRLYQSCGFRRVNTDDVMMQLDL